MTARNGTRVNAVPYECEVHGMMTKTEKELVDALLAIWDDIEFAAGCLAYLENDIERRKAIEYITGDENATAEDIVLFVLEIDRERQKT